MNQFIILIVAFFTFFTFISFVSACHNSTGSCTKTHFVCANEEFIQHSKRCDGVEDCADGTDEYMCEHSSEPIQSIISHKRNALIEVSCIKCTCLKGTILIQSTNTAWFKIALTTPRDLSMMTNAPAYQNKPCNSATGATTSILLNVYKKQNKGCRGWVCCFRQDQCTSCGTGSPATHCY